MTTTIDTDKVIYRWYIKDGLHKEFSDERAYSSQAAAHKAMLDNKDNVLCPQLGVIIQESDFDEQGPRYFIHDGYDPIKGWVHVNHMGFNRPDVNKQLERTIGLSIGGFVLVIGILITIAMIWWGPK